MLITRLYLRNYRVYEDELDLALPGGLVGIVGPNGAGKSALLESILWSLFGHSRTSKDEVRTAGVNGDCTTEVEFEHEGHLYVVRRTLAGAAASVRAQAMADGTQVAEGVQAVRSYVHSVLGMDAGAFRASVFAEQKHLASFSALRPGERRELVLRLLGVTPLDQARDEARRHARQATEAVDRLRQVLPDVDQLAASAEDTAAAASARTAEAEAEAAAAAAAAAALAERQRALEGLEDGRREHDALVAEGRTARAEHTAATEELARLDAEEAELAEVAAALPGAEAVAGGLAGAEERLALVAAVDRAAAALAALPDGVPAGAGPADEAVTEAAATAARSAAGAAQAAAAEAAGRLAGAREDARRAAAARDGASRLSGEADCPVCGQALGAAFQQVQSHRAAEAAEAEARVGALAAEAGSLAEAAAAAAAAARRAELAAEAARATAAEARQQAARRAVARAQLDEAVAALGRPAAPGEAAEAAAAVGRCRQAAAEAARGRVKLERRPAVAAAQESARARAGDSLGRLETLREKVRALGFLVESLDAARQARDQARAAAEQAGAAAQRGESQASEARIRAEAAAAALEQARGQHALLAEGTEDARHLDRLAALLAAFRNSVVAAVGPQLAAGAAELFAELTDREYDRLEVDPLTYEIQIRDAGRRFGMARFSGSEADLANLALRVAISEHVRLLSGGSVGLLVLDEVFGSLDAGRKQKMLAALQQLRSRFRQVLVVTHDEALKAELPSAVEVVPGPPRRATARLVTA